MEQKKDLYLENLYLELELINLTLEQRQKFSKDVVAKAEQMKKETEDLIRRRELIPIDQRL